MLNHLGMHPHHLIPRDVYMKNDIPVAGVRPPGRAPCRFGTDPATSVLDANCKAHELDNLYVVDTSFFPSIGAVNPALTAMANALRVGDHLSTPRLTARRHGEAQADGAPRARSASSTLAGLVQGITLVTFPAASSIFTSPTQYGLTQHAVRRDVPAAGRHGDRRLAARREAGAPARASSACSSSGWSPTSPHALLVVSAARHRATGRVAYPLLLLATACLGARLRADRPGAQHVRRRVPPRPRPTVRCWCSTRCSGWAPRWRRCSSRCSSGSGSGGGCPCCRPCLLAGAAAGRAPAAAAGRRRGRASARRLARPRGIPRGASGCSPASRCCTASARP